MSMAKQIFGFAIGLWDRFRDQQKAAKLKKEALGLMKASISPLFTAIALRDGVEPTVRWACQQHVSAAEIGVARLSRSSRSEDVEQFLHATPKIVELWAFQTGRMP